MLKATVSQETSVTLTPFHKVGNSHKDCCLIWAGNPLTKLTTKPSHLNSHLRTFVFSIEVTRTISSCTGWNHHWEHYWETPPCTLKSNSLLNIVRNTWLIRESPFLLHISAATWATKTRHRKGYSTSNSTWNSSWNLKRKKKRYVCGSNKSNCVSDIKRWIKTHWELQDNLCVCHKSYRIKFRLLPSQSTNCKKCLGKKRF